MLGRLSFASCLLLILQSLRTLSAQTCQTFDPPCQDHPPTITISPVGGTYSTALIDLTIFFHDDFSLNWGTLSTTPSGLSVTQDPYTGSGYARGTITLQVGTNTVTAYICDYNDPAQCVTSTATYTYSPPPQPPPQGAPIVGTLPNNGENRDVGLCVNGCFENVLAYSTPSYVSLDVPHSVTLVFWPPRVTQRATVVVEADANSQTAPAQMSFRLQRPSQAWVSFDGVAENTTELFFGSGSGITRLGGRFLMTGNPSGAYDFTAVVANIWQGQRFETQAGVRVLYVDGTQSPYGAGWSLAGLQRVDTTAGGVILSDGGGSVAFFANCTNGCNTYTSPKADFSRLTRRSNGMGWDRSWSDSTRASYDQYGRLDTLSDRWGNKVRYGYSGTSNLLTSITDPVGKVIVLSYDANNKLDWIQDPGGRITQVTVDATGNLVQVDDPDGVRALFVAYDPSTRLPIYSIGRRNGRRDYTYDQGGKLTRVQLPSVLADGQIVNPIATIRSVDSLVLPSGVGVGTQTNPVPRPQPEALRARVTNPKGDSTRYTLNEWGQATTIESRDAQGKRQTSWFVYRPDGQISEAHGMSGGFRYYYDIGSRLMEVQNISTGMYTLYSYEPKFGQVDSILLGGITLAQKNFYGSDGILDSSRAYTATTKYTFDVRGRVLTIRDPVNHLASMAYFSTDFQNTLSMSRPAGDGSTGITSFEYDSYGRLKKVTEPSSLVRQTSYDLLNRPMLTIGPIGDSVRIGHDDTVRRDSVIDAIGLVYKTISNALGWVEQRIDTRGAVEQYGYDRKGNVNTYTNRRGQLVQFTYDPLDRPLTITAGGQVTSFGYDTAAKWVAVSNAESIDTIKTDSDGRPLETVTIRGGVRFVQRATYTTEGLRTTLSVSREGTGAWTKGLGFGADEAFRFNWLKNFANQVTTLSYNADGLTDTVRLPITTSGSDKLKQGLSYTPGHLMSQRRYSWGPHDEYFGRTYTYDALDRMMSSRRYYASYPPNSASYRRSYGYDQASRLTSYADYNDWLEEQVVCDDPLDLSTCHSQWIPHSDWIRGDTYTYDKNGNRTDHGAVWDLTTKRLVKFNGDSLVYDADGNITKRRQNGVDVQRLYWDSRGQLVAVWTSGADSVTFGYDGYGRRARKTKASGTARYLWDGDDVVMQLDGNGNAVWEYAYYPGIDRPHSVRRSSDNATFYYTTELQGHISGLISSSNQLVNRYEYTPWGEPITTTEGMLQPLRYAAREFDSETGLYYVRARYYSPRLARFMSDDPIGLAGGTNLQSYAENDPVNTIDPTGLDPTYIAQLGLVMDCYTFGMATRCYAIAINGVSVVAGPGGMVTTIGLASNPSSRGGYGTPYGTSGDFPSQWARQLALDDFRAGIQRRARIHAAEIIGQRAKCALGALAFGANVFESWETLVGVGQISMAINGSVAGAGLNVATGLSSATGADVGALFAQMDAMLISGGSKLVGPLALSARGLATGLDVGSGEFGWGNLVPGVGAVKAYHTIAENC